MSGHAHWIIAYYFFITFFIFQNKLLIYLTGHAHWINTLALNTDYALRTSCFDAKTGCEKPKNKEEVREG